MTLPSKTAGNPDGLAGHMVGLAQLAERLVVVQEVAGSTPVAHPHEGQDVRPYLKAAPVIRCGLYLFPHCIKGTT